MHSSANVYETKLVWGFAFEYTTTTIVQLSYIESSEIKVDDGLVDS